MTADPSYDHAALEAEPLSIALSSQMRQMVDDNFHQALENINTIHAPLQLVDKGKANRLAKISYDLAQLHREAHRDELISSLEPTEADFQFDNPSDLAQNQDIHEKKREKPTWAKIAAPKAGELEGKQMSIAPEAVGKRRSDSLNIGSGGNTISYGGEEDQRRLVNVHGLDVKTTLKDISRKISEGPLISLNLSVNADNTKSASIVFLEVLHAKQFVARSDALRRDNRNGPGLYGQPTRVILGPPFRDDEVVYHMYGRDALRRRFTISGKGLFTNVQPTKFYLDLAAVVGKEHLELVWLFNRGNGTVVLSGVRQAVDVVVWLRKKASGDGPYQGADVQFSHDFCELRVPLVSQMSGGGEIKV